MSDSPGDELDRATPPTLDAELTVRRWALPPVVTALVYLAGSVLLPHLVIGDLTTASTALTSMADVATCYFPSRSHRFGYSCLVSRLDLHLACEGGCLGA
jgi:hypothetical protein